MSPAGPLRVANSPPFATRRSCSDPLQAKGKTRGTSCCTQVGGTSSVGRVPVRTAELAPLPHRTRKIAAEGSKRRRESPSCWEGYHLAALVACACTAKRHRAARPEAALQRGGPPC